MKNNVYLKLPVLKKDASGDQSQIRTMETISQEEFVAIVRNAKKLCQLVAGENDTNNAQVGLYYVREVLAGLHAIIKQLPRTERMHNITGLMQFFDEFTDMKPSEDAVFRDAHADLEPYADMLHAYLQNLEHSAIANADGVADKIHGLQLNYQGDWLSLKLFDNPIELYQWQTEHRDPQRQYDPNYEKHSKVEKTGKKGQPISAITYTKEQLEQFLKLALRASRTNAELYFHDVEMGKYIIFFNENTNSLYHAFEFAEDNQEEIQKIWARGGRDLKNRIDMVTNLSLAGVGELMKKISESRTIK